MSRNAMLFAAGLGTRMGALTARRPKPLIEVAGRPLIDHALDCLAAAGARLAVVNTHYRAEMLEAHLARERRLEIVVSREIPELLETGGGMRRARADLGEAPVWALNADAVWSGPPPLESLSALPPGAEACLLLIPRERALGHTGPGDFFLENDGRLRRRGGADTAPFVYTGLQLIDPRPVYAVPKAIFSLNEVWDEMLARGTLRGAVYTGAWCDVGRPGSISIAEEMLRP